jgi:hypothetical protein
MSWQKTNDQTQAALFFGHGFGFIYGHGLSLFRGFSFGSLSYAIIYEDI